MGFILVDTTWTLWNSWTACNQICDTGTKYRDRQCPGSNPLGTINKPAKTPQYGGERDCAGDSREQPNCNTHSCSRKKKRYVDEKIMNYYIIIIQLCQNFVTTFYVNSAIDVTHKYGSKCAASMSMYNSKIVEIKSPNYPKNYANSVSVDICIY